MIVGEKQIHFREQPSYTRLTYPEREFTYSELSVFHPEDLCSIQ